MPTTRHRRTRVWEANFDHYRLAQLAQGEDAALLAGVGYAGLVPDGINHWTDADHATVREAMVRDWARHGEAITAWWTREIASIPAARPWIFPHGPGSRPWAWWEFEAPEPRRPGEDAPAYLDRLNLWRPGERAKLEIANA